MKTAATLFVTQTLTLAELCRPPWKMTPETAVVTGFSSLRYINASKFSAVVLHEPPPGLLNKAGSGIRDDNDSEAIWALFNSDNRPPVFQITLPGKPLTEREKQLCRNLSIDCLTPAQLCSLMHCIDSNHGVKSIRNSQCKILTADDIREMHHKGIKTFNSSSRLTPWAEEVAASLKITATPDGKSDDYMIHVLRFCTRPQILERSALIYSAATAIPDLLFVPPLPLLVWFREKFASLKGRMVSPAIHTQQKGAFTGEVSLEMLIDIGCVGAFIQPSILAAGGVELANLCKRAGEKGFLLFGTIPVEQIAEYDIMAAQGHGIIPLAWDRDYQRTPDALPAGVVMPESSLTRTLERKTQD